MQRDIVIKGRSLGGCSDLTLLAPIKPGFVESLESVTYKTRIKRVLETLHGARMAAHEHHTARLLSDSIERVGAIQSVRVAVLEADDKVLLAVSFDGSWESYIRVLWDKVGTLLDLIFCGTVDYVSAYEHSFDEWLEWARRVQVETGFFYGPPESSARDVLYQRRLERMRLRGAGAELNEVRAVLPSAEEAVQRLVNVKPDPPYAAYEDEPRIERGSNDGWPRRMLRERIRVGLQGLAGLYRLTELHRPSTPDGDVLRRAAIDLLVEFVRLRGAIKDELAEARKTRFARQIDWLFPDEGNALVPRPIPGDAEDAPQLDESARRDIQGGILQPYNRITHGLLLMLAFENAAAAKGLFDWLDSHGHRLTRDVDPHDAAAGRVFRNLALTPAGLRAIGIGEDALELFPEEFRQGMAARAGSIGDVRNNHPRRWRLPKHLREDLNFGNESIELDTVHAVFQLRCRSSKRRAQWDEKHPLRAEVDRLRSANPAVRLLTVQPLLRRYSKQDRTQIEEHFGYADGIGQPDLSRPDSPVDRNRVHFGEVILGHDNAADFAIDPSDPDLSEPLKERARWLANGSFLVMRKYRQFAHRMETAVAAAADAMSAQTGSRDELIERVYAKLVGRSRKGIPLATHTGHPNNFTYDGDAQGTQCPLNAHIRLANPRMEKGNGAARLPRLMRRGMSYGPAHKPGKDDDATDRGVVFMAYNASIGEQYEVVQRWLTGGNSTGSSSGQGCPIVGVPENGLTRYFRFEHPDASGNAQVFRVALGTPTPLFEEPEVLTRLDWGLYLFTPSLSVLRRLRAVAATAAGMAPAVSAPWHLARGRQLLAALKQLESEQGGEAALEAWKAALEDPEAIDRLDSAAVWAAIRDDHGGVLKTPYGTLVASRELLSQVLLDPHERYSVCGQLERMKRSFGEISLGLDAGPVYERESRAINGAIGVLTRTKTGKLRVFHIARKAASTKIDKIIAEAIEHSFDAEDERFEVAFDAREVVDEVLVDLCEAWFGLNDDLRGRLSRGSADWAWKRGDPPLYPGHFTALSRYMFQPNPGKAAVELGESYGQALREAMRLFVGDHRGAGTIPKAPNGKPAPIASAAFTMEPQYSADDDFVARTMVGVLMGFTPTIIGAILNVLREWQREGRFGALRAELGSRDDYCSAHAVISASMAAAARMRPMPQIAWRTVRKPHRLGAEGPGGIDLAVGERIVLAFVSGTQQALADGASDGRLMFGGVREVDPHPTHACPGYQAGIEAMVGALTALLARPEAMRQAAAPLAFVIEGRSGYTPPAATLAWMQAARPAAALPGVTGLVMGWGDSWLDATIIGVRVAKDLMGQLEDFGYEVENEFCDYSRWGTIQQMADDPHPFCNKLLSLINKNKTPRAILLSGGGNDSTGDDLKKLLSKKGSGTLLIGPNVVKHIDKLKKNYRTVLAAIEKKLESQSKPMVPVIVHGYDDPKPKWRRPYLAEYDKHKLKLAFEDKAKGYDIKNATDRNTANDAMSELMKELNEMLSKLKNEFPFVTYVRLTRTIEDSGRWGEPADAWADDLHPSSKAFELLAVTIHTNIQTLPVVAGPPPVVQPAPA